MMAAWTPEAFAYFYMGPKWSNPANITVNNIDSIGAAAANSWNVTPTRVYFNYNHYGSVDVVAGKANYGNTWWSGLTTPQSTGGYYTSQTIQINLYYTDGYSNWETQGVWAHEFGHVVGLAHDNGSTGFLMYFSDARTVNSPTIDEINGTNGLYP